jgi:hypothetical protein
LQGCHFWVVTESWIIVAAIFLVTDFTTDFPSVTWVLGMGVCSAILAGWTRLGNYYVDSDD